MIAKVHTTSIWSDVPNVAIIPELDLQSVDNECEYIDGGFDVV